MADPLHLQVLPAPNTGTLRPVLVESWDSFWVREPGNWSLDHYVSGEVVESIQAPSGVWRSVEYHFIPEGDLICCVVDWDYASTVFRYERGRWISENVHSTRPTNRFVTTRYGNTWAIGDWGELYRREAPGHWVHETSPSGNHGFTLVESEGGVIWLGTRGDGLYRINPSAGDTTEIHIPGHENGDVKVLAFYDGLLYAGFSEGAIFQVRGIETTKWWPEGVPRSARWIGLTHDGEGLVFLAPGELTIWQGGETRQYEVPYPGFIDAVVLPGDRLLLFTHNGGLIRATPAVGAVFYNLTSRLRIGGSPDDQSIGATLAELAHDPRQELWVLNSGVTPHNPLYNYTDGGNFVEITREAGLLNTRGAQQGAFGDMNRDGLPDLILYMEEGSRQTVQWWKNIGRERLEPWFSLPVDSLLASQPRALTLLDSDRDGDLDLLLTCYYGPGGERRGRNILFENRRRGNLQLVEEPGDIDAPGWNQAVLPFDFNSDGWLDLYVMNRWVRDRLILGGEEGWRDGTDSFLSDDTVTASMSGVALDIDRDGDLDLVLSRIDSPVTILENLRGEKLVNETRNWCPEAVGADWQAGDIKALDLEGDGWYDLVVAGGGGRESNLVLRGCPNGFSVSREPLGLRKPVARSLLVGDLDQDYDPDIYGLRQGSNVAWVNQLQVKRHARLVLRGSHSNGSGLHAKWWTWKEGGLGHSDALLGHGQVGAVGSTYDMVTGQNELLISVPDGEPIDLTVQFYGGSMRELHGIRPGETIVIHDQLLLMRTATLLPGRILSLLQRREVRLHLLGFLLTGAFLVGSLQIGSRHFRWSIRLVVTLAVVSLSAYWLMLMLASGINAPGRFVAPPATVLIIVGIPLMISVSTRGYNRAARETLYEGLLQNLLAFAHGAWAASNLDSLKRVGEHLLRSAVVDERQLTQLTQRVETWREMTRPSLVSIVEAAKSLSLIPATVQTLSRSMEELDQQLELALRREVEPGSDEEAGRLARASDELRTALREIRDVVYRRYSCDVLSVLRHTVAELTPMLEREGVTLEPLPSQSGRVWGLIRTWELADILDNSLVNAVRAVRGRDEKRVHITLEVMAGHVRLNITDTGCGVPEEDRDRIFQEAVSGLGGTGHGLAQARKRLDRYGGNIFLTASEVNVGSTFTIQLNEGRENLEAKSTDHRR